MIAAYCAAMNSQQESNLLEQMQRIEDKLDRLLDRETTVRGDPREVADVNRPLFDALVEWRRAEAERQDVRPFRIFGNATLAAIANQRPADKFEFSKVKGVGDDKMERYADAVLAIVDSGLSRDEPW